MALDHFKEECGAILDGLREDLEQISLVVSICEDPQLRQFVDRLVESVKHQKEIRTRGSYEEFIGQKFAPLKPVLNMLHVLVHSEGWPRNDLALGELLLVVSYFKQVVGERLNF